MPDPIRQSAPEAILSAAFEILPERPDASLSDIAERAGVGRATLHRHFSGREDLIKQLTLTALEDMETAVTAACTEASSHTDALRIAMETLIPLGDRYAFLDRETGYDDPDIEAEWERQAAETLQMVKRSIAEGGLPGTYPARWYVRAFDALLLSAWEAVEEGELTVKQAAHYAWTHFSLNKDAEYDA